MKKIFIFIIVILGIIYGYYKFIYSRDNINNILKNTENESFYVERYTIFGTHLNISACMDNILDGDLSLVLKNNNDEINIKSEFTVDDNTCFILSDNNNEGIYLDDLKLGNYVLLVKEINNDDIKYYSLENKTEYNDLTYYTITHNDKNNKINIKFDRYNDKEYLILNISKTSLPDEVYDITIDPGHGGNDPGTSYKLNNKVYNESEIILKIALLLKKDLEDLGLKVKLTRDSDDNLPNYGSDGRSVIPNKVNSKYSISIHINSFSGNMNYGGVEIYTPNNINYEFASLLADNISDIVGYSKKQIGKVDNGVYYTYFTKEDIQDSKEEMLEENKKPYDIEVGAPYMFMIREVGGINTYAYVDGRNVDHGYNEFFNLNQTAEPYLLELGYINYEKDLESLANKPELFSKAISKAIQQHLNVS